MLWHYIEKDLLVMFFRQACTFKNLKHFVCSIVLLLGPPPTLPRIPIFPFRYFIKHQSLYLKFNCSYPFLASAERTEPFAKFEKFEFGYTNFFVSLIFFTMTS
jgi:hypothetical protein